MISPYKTSQKTLQNLASQPGSVQPQFGRAAASRAVDARSSRVTPIYTGARSRVTSVWQRNFNSHLKLSGSNPHSLLQYL